VFLAWLMATLTPLAPWQAGVCTYVSIRCEASFAECIGEDAIDERRVEQRSGTVPGSIGPVALDPAARFRRLRPLLAAPDSGQGLFEYSDGYSTRLDIHRVASYATLPLFLAQVVIGEVLLRNLGSQPAWAKSSHGPIAGALAGLFVVNTVTGGLNLLEARRDPNVEGRTLLHSMIMIIADAGFVWTGLSVSKAGTVAPNGRVRTGHRRIALISMGIATTGYLLMIPPFRGY